MSKKIQLTEKEFSIINQYKKFFQVSSIYYNTLKSLPVVGFFYWQNFFQETFKHFTSLWKFQNDHRKLLETKFNLTRFEVGEIARKIGELYLQYYFRTSNTRYLENSFQFYSAIRSRDYFGDLSINKNKRILVIRLIKEVKELIQKNSERDAKTWLKIIGEVEEFVQNEMILSVGKNPNQITYRNFSYQYDDNKSFKITKAILISSDRSSRIKFVDITLNLYKFIQSLEIEPLQGINFSSNMDIKYGKLKTPDEGKNCYKTFLYRTSFGVLMRILASSFSSSPNNNCLMLYFDLNCDKDGNFILNQKIQTSNENNLFNLNDVLPFSRKMLFIIVDSNKNFKFKKELKSYSFKNPFCCLYYKGNDNNKVGTIFTSFLTEPLLAFLKLVNIKNITLENYNSLSGVMSSYFNKVKSEMISHNHNSVVKFLENPYTKNYILRFTFLKNVFLFFKKEEEFKNLSSFPELPNYLFKHNKKNSMIQLIEELLKVVKK